MSAAPDRTVVSIQIGTPRSIRFPTEANAKSPRIIIIIIIRIAPAATPAVVGAMPTVAGTIAAVKVSCAVRAPAAEAMKTSCHGGTGTLGETEVWRSHKYLDKGPRCKKALMARISTS
jgi:hypothetical protein